MFSSQVNPPSTRNPKRRQRTGSDDSVALRHNPKRLRRAGLSSETFKAPSNKDGKNANGFIQPVETAPQVNGHAQDPRSQRDVGVDTTSLAMRHRGSKRGEKDKRGNKGDGSTELTKNDIYIVTQLPTTPDRLQNNHSAEKWQGEFSAHIGYAVAMTQNQAIVWRYFQGVNPKDSIQPLIINLQNFASDARGQLPFGLVVPTSAEPAFLVVTAASGQITYWESLSSASSVDLNRQKQQGTRGTVSGMMSGEIITKVTEAEPHGFLLTFNTGRFAHMTVCDPHGKPSISVQYLRSSGSYTGGLFGSLKNVFNSAGWRRDVAAVKAGSSWQRGQRYAVVATSKGVFQVWDLCWNGTHSLVHEIDAKEDFLKVLQAGGHREKDRHDHLFQVLDFAFLPGEGKGKELTKSIERGDCKLLVLTAITSTDSWRYTLVGITLAQGSLDIDVLHPISCYTTPLPAEPNFRPQVLAPKPAKTAFIVFEKTIVLVSLAEVEVSPSSQLQIEAHTLPDPFQDAIDFCKAKSYRVVGCAAEPFDRTENHSSCVLMVLGFGIVRVAALPLKEGQSALDRANVTARTKVEQAVFYGSLQQDLLDFSGRPEISFAKEEVQAAALAVSQSIMQSTSAYISALGPSMDQQLQRRSVALADLMKHLAKNHEPLDRLTRWELLWNAEKMAAAGAIWKCYNAAIASKDENGKNLLAEIIDRLHENFKHENNPAHYETDAVRHWFIHDIGRLEFIIPWAQHAVEQLFNESLEDNIEIDSFTKARLLNEANDIQLSALETAFIFRETNAALYGMENDAMADGVLADGYEELPEIWTSKLEIVPKVKLLVDLSREVAVGHNEPEDEPMAKLIDRLMANNPRLIEICCRTYSERTRWLRSRNDNEFQVRGRELQQEYLQVRRILFVKLSDLGLGQEGIRLADKYQDMNALVDIIDIGMEDSLHPGSRGSEKEEAHQMVQLLKKQIHSYFVRFGKRWANAYFTKHILGGKSMVLFSDARVFNDARMFNDTTIYQKHLSTFLRHPKYAKLGWINEVHSERDYSAAAHALRAAETQETSLWAKKIQLSMGKLAMLAAKCKGQEKDDSVDTHIQNSNRNIACLSVQEKLYNYIRPALNNAIDATAETELACEQYCKRFVKGKSALGGVLIRNFHNLIAREALDSEELIDTLTLLDEVSTYPDEEGFGNKRFFYALKLVKLSSFEAGELARKDLLEKIIWRRCMIQDNWVAINRTEHKGDKQVEVETGASALFKTLREGYKTDFFLSSTPVPPTAILGAGTTLESLRTITRYAQYADNTLTQLAKDFGSEDKVLEGYIEKGRLEQWWRGFVEAAQKSAREEKEQTAEDLKRRRSVESSFWKRLEPNNPSLIDGRENGEIIFDGQGDVIMGF